MVVASALFLLGISSKVAARRLAAQLALVAIVAVIVIQGGMVGQAATFTADRRRQRRRSRSGPFANYVKLITGVVGALLVLLAWPTNRDATGSRSLDFGRDAGEFYGLMLLSLAGLMLVAGANDMMLLFLGHRAGQHPDLHHGLDVPRCRRRRRLSPFSRNRSSSACMRRLISPTSSRNSVPRCASWSLPRLSR